MTIHPETDLPRSVLVVDDDEAILAMVDDLLQEAGFHVRTAGSADDALRIAEQEPIDVVLTDIHMPGKDGLELLAELRELQPETPVLLMTAFGSIKDAVGAMRAGALDYVAKPFEADELLVALERAFERRELEAENRTLRRAVERSSSFGELVGKSPAMNDIYALVRKIANTRSNVLITGESGTGKEVVARTIHFAGARRERPFVPINCTAMPEGLLESELFGHVKGAFTGAHVDKEGLFEKAQGGTLFLDEIGDMPLALQGKLLRVLQDRAVRPVGSTDSTPVDVRVIAATHQDLEQAITAGRFRHDLYYRLNVIPIEIPPLHERPEDIPVLAEAFLRKHGKSERQRITERAMRKLMQSPWPGNARELENCIERAVALSDADAIRAADVVLPSEEARSDDALRDGLVQLALQRRATLRELGDAYVEAALVAAKGRKSEAARILAVNRRTLYRREERQRAANED